MTTATDASLIDPPAIGPDVKSLSRAVVYRFLSYAYQYPWPDIQSCLRTLSSAVENSLGGLTDCGYRDLRTEFHSLNDSRESANLEIVEEEWILLFGHSAQGTCPPYEGEYTESEEGLQQPHELGDLNAFYRAFGLELGAKTHERSDFVGVELAYLSFLCQKQAYAEETRDNELADPTVKAQISFLRDHLGRWAPTFARRILDQTGQGFYRHLAAFTLAFLLEDCRELGVEPGSDRLRVRKVCEEPEDYMECPMATAGNKNEPGPE